jgi:hypothetical protein
MITGLLWSIFIMKYRQFVIMGDNFLTNVLLFVLEQNLTCVKEGNFLPKKIMQVYSFSSMEGTIDLF